MNVNLNLNLHIPIMCVSTAYCPPDTINQMLNILTESCMLVKIDLLCLCHDRLGNNSHRQPKKNSCNELQNLFKCCIFETDLNYS